MIGAVHIVISTLFLLPGCPAGLLLASPAQAKVSKSTLVILGVPTGFVDFQGLEILQGILIRCWHCM
jgi:hypothetical protein